MPIYWGDRNSNCDKKYLLYWTIIYPEILLLRIKLSSHQHQSADSSSIFQTTNKFLMTNVLLSPLCLTHDLHVYVFNKYLLNNTDFPPWVYHLIFLAMHLSLYYACLSSTTSNSDSSFPSLIIHLDFFQKYICWLTAKTLASEMKGTDSFLKSNLFSLPLRLARELILAHVFQMY